MHKAIYVTPVKQTGYTTEGKIVCRSIPISKIFLYTYYGLVDF